MKTCRCCGSDVKILHEGECRIDENGEWLPRRWVCESCKTAEHFGRRLKTGNIVKVLTNLKDIFYAYYELSYPKFKDDVEKWNTKRENRFILTAEINKINLLLKESGA